jgi:hypothetical protein
MENQIIPLSLDYQPTIRLNSSNLLKLQGLDNKNVAGLRFDDFETLLAQCDWALDRQGGSHRVWYSPKDARPPVQAGQAGKAKPYQVRQFLAIYRRETP